MSDHIHFMDRTPAQQDGPIDRIQQLADQFGQHPALVRELVAALGRPTKHLLLVKEVEEALSVSRSTVYRLIREKKLDRADLDRTTRVTAASLERYVEQLIADSNQEQVA